MALDPVLPMSNGSTPSPITISAAQFRRLDVASTMAHDLHDLSTRAGVCSGFVASVSGLTVTVGVGSAIVTPSNTANGSYRVAAGTPTALTLGARNATYSRRDLVVLRVSDGSVDSSGKWVAELVAIPGLASATPIDPVPLVGDLILARAIVPPTGNVTMVDRRDHTASLGGVIPCLSTARPSGPSLRAGQQIFESDTGRVQVWTGTAWRDNTVPPTLPAAMASGIVTLTVSASAGATAVVTFPAGRFAAPPIVQATKASSGLAKFVPYVIGITASQCTIGLYSGDGTSGNASIPVAWLAMSAIS